jgi:hypothetical protein
MRRPSLYKGFQRKETLSLGSHMPGIAARQSGIERP